MEKVIYRSEQLEKVLRLVSNPKKKRIFYGCERYPDCEFTSWDKPVGRDCPKCEHYLVEKVTKKQRQVKCSNCDYKEDVQK